MSTENFEELQQMLTEIQQLDPDELRTYHLITRFKRKVNEMFPFDSKKYYQAKRLEDKSYCKMCNKYVTNIDSHEESNTHKLNKSIFILKEAYRKKEEEM